MYSVAILQRFRRYYSRMIEVRDIDGKLLYTDTDHSDTSELWCEGIDLRRADFRGWDLSYAYFDSCDLRGARFDGSNLYETRLLWCELENVSFREANLLCAVIDSPDFYYDCTVDLEDAIIPGTNRPSYM